MDIRFRIASSIVVAAVALSMATSGGTLFLQTHV